MESHERLSMLVQTMSHTHDAKQWERCVEIGDAWLREENGRMPALVCIWYAQSLMGVGRFDDAVPWAKVAAEAITPETTEEAIGLCAARSTYAQALARVGKFAASKRVLKQMVETPIQHPETLEKQGHILLAISDRWRDAWAMHEHRASNAALPDGLARWDGVTQQRVGVLHEQGIGDAVLFARWLPYVAERTGHPVTWFGPEKVLGRWMADLPGVVVGDRTVDPKTLVDAACFAMSLPHLIGCDRSKFVPAPVAPAKLLQHRAHHRISRESIKVGVCWQGSKDGWHDFERSFRPVDFAPIVDELAGVEFVNLTHDADVPLDAPFAPRVFTDIADTAEVLLSLDLVVTVDTSVAHIAGSLGIPTLVIAPTVPDWRYAWPKGVREPGSSPFYPSVTVLRRPRADDLSVIAAARWHVEAYAKALKRRVA